MVPISLYILNNGMSDICSGTTMRPTTMAIMKLRPGKCIQVLVDAAEFGARAPAVVDLDGNEYGMGRELFAPFRRAAGTADMGASVLF